MKRTSLLASHVLSSTHSHLVTMDTSLNVPAEKPLVVTIIGGGNSGHVCASLIHENSNGRIKVQLFTSKPKQWSQTPLVTFPDGTTQKGYLSVISSDPREVFPQSDIILWTGPVNATKAVFENIRLYIDPRKTVVGTIFAQGLTHLLAHRIFGPEMKFFALRNIPWLCRTVQPGSECAILGTKTSIDAAVVNLSPEWIATVLEPLFVVGKTNEPTIVLLPDFVPIVFNPANQLIHPAVYYSLFRKWRRGSELPPAEEPSEWLYRGMSELAGNILDALDEELQAIKDAYYKATGAESCLSVLPLRERILLQYGDQVKDTSTTAKVVGTNTAYAMARTPMIKTATGVSPNPDHRVVVDDIGWGLCVLVSIADRLSVPTYMMKMMIQWHQDLMDKEYLLNGMIAGRDASELVLLGRKDSLTLVGNVPKSTLYGEEYDEERIGNP